jgi:gliding motility-associated-like protein
MKRTLLTIILLLPLVGISQSIVVNDPMAVETNYTPEQMITEVLIGGSGCGDVAFTFLQENPDGATNIDERSWGYFDATGTSFPFESGLVMSGGFAKSAEGPNDNEVSDTGPGWGGDADLQAVLFGLDGLNEPTNNATVFQFTFVPVISEMSFDFIFASEEYEDQFECSAQFRDGFAFLLKGPGIPDDSGTVFGGTNIAAVPGSAGVVVNTLSIHDDSFTCGSEMPGVNFFPELYVSNQGVNNLNEIQFDGYTQALIAMASLTPGETYELKMVTGDRGDTAFDSAVFFREGSFNIGVALPPDATIVSGNAPCEGDAFTFGVEESSPGATFQWYIQNPTNGMFDILPDETDNEITVTQGGTFQLEAILSADCTATDEIIIEFSPQPVAVIPDLIRECDDAPNDGITIFDLTQADAQIINGQMDVLVDYYESEFDAEMEINVIPDPTMYQNIVPNFQIVYGRLEDIFRNCFDVVPLEIQVDFAPEITVPISDLFQCDNDEDGIETVDLTSKEDEILNDLVDVGLEYFETLADAQAGTNPIANPSSYTSGFTTIYVQATNSLGCTTEGSFDLILGETPPFSAPFPLIGCDVEDNGTAIFDPNEKNNEIVNGAIGLSVTYFGNIIDAQDAENPLIIPYTSTGETIWVRIEDDATGCYSITTLELQVAPLPTICQPEPLVFCDSDNDGIGEFMLTDRDDEVRCGDPAGFLVVSYHETQGEANGNTNALVSPYLNIVPFNQTIIARLTDLNTGCFDTIALELIVGDSPVITAPEPLILCDDDDDGEVVFNLTSVEAQMLPSGTFIVEYFETQANADSGSNPISNPITYTNQPSLGNPQIIYIAVTDIDNGCMSQTTVELIVNLQPILTAPTPLILCDLNNPGDEIEIFDLNATVFEITGGDLNVDITFYETQMDADNGTNPITNPGAYPNIENPQAIYIKAEDATTGCIETMTVALELRVENTPSPETPEPLVVCDDNNDGYAFFDLTVKSDEIIGGEMNILISYYETQLDADNATNAIDTTILYSNIIQFMQTVYVRLEYDATNMGNGCYNTITLDLVVTDSPVIPLELEPLIACESDGDGIAVFDLTQQSLLIYGDQDPDDFTLTYHESLAFAEAGMPVISNPMMFTNTSNPQTIWYRLDTDDTDNLCNSIGSFELQVVNGPVAVGPLEVEVCDTLGEPGDGVFTFDLTIYDDTITGGIPGINVQYFLTDAEAQGNENPISPANEHMNVNTMGDAINPQTLFVRVTDSNSACFDFTTIRLRVVSNPAPATDVVLELCDYNNAGDEIEIFDLTDAAPLITGGANWTVQYYATYQDAFDMMNGIPDPTMYESQMNPDVVYIRVDTLDNTSGCFEIVAVQLIVNALPDDTAVLTSLVVCETPNDGIAEFDLTLKKDEALGPDQDPADFEVSYYETALDAEMMVNPIAPANMYPATITPGMPLLIYIGITNLETGCYIGGVQFFELETRDGATATAPAEPYALCDTEGANDGFTVFDLSTLDDEILGGQDPAVYGVLYYETLENALEGIDPITPKTSYTNIINPQEIYATVTNALSECSETVVVILNVEQLPFFELPETFRLCVDENGNPIQEDSGEESPPTFGIDLDENLYVFEWTLDGAVLEGEIGNTVTAVAGGVYQVTATEIATGCSATAMTTVTLSAPPINFSARLVDGAFSGSNTVEVTTEGIGTYEYSIGDGPFQEGTIFENVAAGSQMITIRDVNGCGEATFKFGVIDYDRFMTPNGDGFNDTWKIESIASFDPSANIYIFDRYGKLLKQLSPINDAGWDGTYNGTPLPSSDYWFLIEYTEDDTRKEFRGHFTLKR